MPSAPRAAAEDWQQHSSQACTAAACIKVLSEGDVSAFSVTLSSRRASVAGLPHDVMVLAIS